MPENSIHTPKYCRYLGIIIYYYCNIVVTFSSMEFAFWLSKKMHKLSHRKLCIMLCFNFLGIQNTDFLLNISKNLNFCLSVIFRLFCPRDVQYTSLHQNREEKVFPQRRSEYHKEAYKALLRRQSLSDHRLTQQYHEAWNWT